MLNVKRWYIYLVCAVTIQVVTWAVIALLRRLISSTLRTDLESLALALSVIIIGLPIFLLHWLWAQRIVTGEPAERLGFPRLLYLVAMLGAFTGPLLNSAFYAGRDIFFRFLGERPPFEISGDWRTFGIGLPVLLLMWSYHYWIWREDRRIAPANDTALALRQLYVYFFAAAGLGMAVVGVVALLAWLGRTLAGATVITLGPNRTLATELARLAVGVPAWLLFWSVAQRHFHSDDRREQASVVRKVYLYLVLFLSVIAAVGSAAVLLNDVLTRLLGGEGSSEPGGIYRILGVILVAGMVWGYHAAVLQRDTALIPEQEKQALVRRVYRYLLAGVGLAAVLIGLGGILSVIIRGLSPADTVADLRLDLAQFMAALLAGLPVWLFSWRLIQHGVAAPGAAGQAERQSEVRTIYLYFYLFLATMTILGSAVYVLSQFVELLLGGRSAFGLVNDVGQALAFSAIAAAVLAYHGSLLRREGALTRAEAQATVQPLRVVVVDDGSGELGRALLTHIHDAVPTAQLLPLGLSPAAAAAMNGEGEATDPQEMLAAAEVIVGPWHMAVAGAGAITPPIAASVSRSPARKVLIPVQVEGWAWTGVEPWHLEKVADEAAAAVKQLASGDGPAASRLPPLTLALAAVLALGSLCLLLPLTIQFIVLLFGA